MKSLNSLYEYICDMAYVEILWPESASQLYRPSDRRLSAKLMSTLANKGCYVVSVMEIEYTLLPYV
jgi:hypothetical protein